MHKVGDLLKDLGFNKDAPLETQKAFLRHLIAKAAIPKDAAPAPSFVATPTPAKVEEPVQLSFDPKILGCG